MYSFLNNFWHVLHFFWHVSSFVLEMYFFSKVKYYVKVELLLLFTLDAGACT